MDKYRKYYGIILLIVVIVFGLYTSVQKLLPKFNEIKSFESKIQKQEKTLKSLRVQKKTVEEKIKLLEKSAANSQKKIYAPTVSDLDNDTLFFTLYTDIIDMVNSNNVRIKDIKYSHNPADDMFVKFAGNKYFVCNIKMSLVSNYVQLGHLIEDIYQYPYYIKIDSVKVRPYGKDKSILLTDMNVKLYSYTEPQVEN